MLKSSQYKPVTAFDNEAERRFFDAATEVAELLDFLFYEGADCPSNDCAASREHRKPDGNERHTCDIGALLDAYEMMRVQREV
jgi:hypothetical protein